MFLEKGPPGGFSGVGSAVFPHLRGAGIQVHEETCIRKPLAASLLCWWSLNCMHTFHTYSLIYTVFFF